MKAPPTGRTPVLGMRYGELAVAVRDAGGSLFGWVDDADARATVERIGAAYLGLMSRIVARAVA